MDVSPVAWWKKVLSIKLVRNPCAACLSNFHDTPVMDDDFNHPKGDLMHRAENRIINGTALRVRFRG
jgi:hypothetical protein